MAKPMVARRAALLAPLLLAGCQTFDDWFSTKKEPLPGKREDVRTTQRGLAVDEGAPKVTLPPAVRNAAWPQAGGNPAHLMGHLAANERLAPAWTASIGSGGGYREIILAQPVSADGRVHTMDSDGVVSAFALSTGERLWRVDTKDRKADSTNVGGGLAVDQGIVYATNGLGDILALDAASGETRWRKALAGPGRSSPTVAEGRIFVTTIEDRLQALSTEDGRVLWTHRAATAAAVMLGQPAPAFARGLVVAGFGSGEIAALRADTGSVAWTDELGVARGRGSLADFFSVRGAPVIADGRVLAIGLGGLTTAIDLPSGRRLWERQLAGSDSPWAAGNWMFVLSAEQELAALNTTDGRVAWITALPRFADPEKRKDSLTWFGPILLGDRLIVTGRGEEILSISPYTGEILSRRGLSAAASPVSPIAVDGTLLVVSDDARLLALR